MPQDISLIGFDDYAWMRARATPLTAIFQPVRDIGRILWERLSARIKGNVSPAQHVRLPCELRIRASTGPVPNGRAKSPKPESIPRAARTAGRKGQVVQNSGSVIYPEQSGLSTRNLPARQMKGGK
jgi:hypothetical protein